MCTATQHCKQYQEIGKAFFIGNNVKRDLKTNATVNSYYSKAIDVTAPEYQCALVK